MQDIHGKCESDYSAVAEAFEAGFSSGREVGAAVSVWQADRLVVDLWAGFTDRKRSIPWQADTLSCVFSVSKALTTTCVLQAVDAGLLELDRPVAYYWPEFAEADKAEITVRHVLSHRAGLPAFHQPVERELMYDWQGVCDRLAQETPWWPPGTEHGYHARTFGFLLGELLRRCTGLNVGQWLHDKITQPLGLDVHIGLSEAQQQRCATMLPARITPGKKPQRPAAMQAMLKDFNDLSTVTGATFQNPNLGPGYMNRAEFRGAQLPALNGHGTARDIAQLMAVIPDLVSEPLLSEALQTASYGRDQVLKSTTHFGLGYMLHDPQAPIGWPGCFGHAGAGGSLAFCDADKALGFAFTMNQMQEGVVSGGDTANACVAALAETV